MPTARRGLSACIANGKIYAIGGQGGIEFLSTVEEYDPVADKWTEKTDMPMSRFDHACSAMDGKIYVFGGCGDDFAESIGSPVLEYDTGFSGEKVDPEGKLPTTWGDVRTVMKK
jgi:N-acetylneuraminic acid mutarotase